MSGTESGSAPKMWPTPKAERAGNPSTYGRGNPNQALIAETAVRTPPGGAKTPKIWATPTAEDGNRGSTLRPHDTGVPLSQQAATASTRSEPAETPSAPAGSAPPQAPEPVPAPWATPTARDYRSGKASQRTLAKNARPLNEQAATSTWPTPTASDADGGPARAPRDHGPRLRDHAATATKPWGTPRVAANKGRGSARRAKGAGSRIEDQAAATVREPPSNTEGTAASAPRPEGTLNPELSRWLQGYPVLWSNCAPDEKPPKAAPDETGDINTVEPDESAHPLKWPNPLTGEFWQDTELVWCTYDNQPRRVERGTFPIAANIAERAEKLRGYGNSVVPQVAAAFILTTAGRNELEPADDRGQAPDPNPPKEDNDR